MSETEYYKMRIKELEYDQTELTAKFQSGLFNISQSEFKLQMQRFTHKISRYTKRLKEVEMTA